ncbi:MAG: hypothetical protein ACOY5R_06685 [Pseudomonadota bacterium]
MIRALTLGGALALALCAAPAFGGERAGPLLPVATDDAEMFRMPPDWPPAPAAPPPVAPVTPARRDLTDDRIAMCGAFAFDGATTIWSIERGNHEAGPMARLFLGKSPPPLAVAAFMAAKCGALLIAGTAIERKDSRKARFLYRLNIAVSAVAGGNNIAVALKVKL